MNGIQLQEKFFELIRKKIGDQKNWVDLIAEKLSLSKPAVYKRINGSTSLSILEMASLMKAFDLSFDQLVHTEKTNVQFQLPAPPSSIRSFLDFLNPIKYFVSKLTGLENVHILHSTSELHLFNYFMDPELLQFKMFLHAKTIWNMEGYGNRKFSMDNFSGAPLLQKETSEILKSYIHVPSLELFNEHILDNTLNQIKHFLINGFFEDPKIALYLCSKLRELVKHIRKMAREGFKSYPQGNQTEKGAAFELYYNELSYTNNIMIILSDSENYIFNTYDNPNFMISNDQKLVDYTKSWFDRVKKMSTPVSKEGLKSRMLLFKQVEGKINLVEKELETILERFAFS